MTDEKPKLGGWVVPQEAHQTLPKGFYLLDKYEKVEADLKKAEKRLDALESRGEYNKDYGLDLHKELINLSEYSVKLKQIILILSNKCERHEEYLKSIDKIALHDPDKTVANMNVLNNRIESTEKVVHGRIDALHERLNGLEKYTHEELTKRIETVEVLELQNIQNQFSGAFCRIESLEEQNKLETFTTEEALWHKKVDYRLEKLEQEKLSINIYSRLNKLEENSSYYNDQIEYLAGCIENLEDTTAERESVADAFTQLRNSTNERLNILEQMHTENVYKPVDGGNEERKVLENRINELELLVNALRDKYNSMCAPSLKKEPHKCPMCEGFGKIQSTSPSPPYVLYDACKSCKGDGILWG